MHRNLTLPLVVSAVLAAALLTSGVWAAEVPDWMARPGTIGHALTLRDNSHVYLDAVVVDKIKAKQRPDYFTVHECFSARDKIVVLTPPSPELRLGMNVDIEGDITTLPNGRRAITNVGVFGYTDRDGNLLRHGPLIKGLLEPTPWQWKVDLTIESKEAPTPIPPSASEPNITPSRGPVYYPRIGDALGRVRVLATGDFIDLAAFECKPILSTGVDQTYGNYFIMGEDSGPETLKVYYQTAVSTDDRINKISGQLREENGDSVLCVNSGPGYDPQVYEGSLMTVSPDTVAFAMTLPDDESATLAGVVVTANQTDFPGTMYVQEPSDSGHFGGIRVRYSTTTYDRGDILSITGPVSLGADGEREITATDVDYVDEGTFGPLGMPNRVLGGGGFNVYTPGVSNPAGSGTGLYNKGLLVKIWGRVTAVDATNKFFYIDDGTGFEDGTLDGNNQPIKGVRVSWAWSPAGKPSITPPAVNWYVSVTGISGSDTADSGATYYRVMRPRDQSDVLVFSPEDSTSPTITITNPPDGEIHMAPSQNTVQLAGTATDADTGVTSLQVGFTTAGSPTQPTTWYSAVYNSSTQVWTYDWQNPPSTQRIWAKATDFNGHTATTNRDVTVSSATSVKYVRPGGGPLSPKDGSSWDHAEDKVGDALTAATSGSEIWVAQGVYQERITLKSGVAVYGGFTPVDTYRERRNWAINKTILDGNQGGSVVTVPSAAVSATTIDGFTIRNGSASNGGGVYSSYANASATIKNNTIRANKASSNGGGIYVSGSTLTIAGNVLVSNTAGYGGGIYSNNSASQIANNTLICNAASSNGGGVYLGSGAALPTFSNNIIAFNSGGGIYKTSGEPTFTRNDVYGNSGNGKYEYSWTTTYPVGTDLAPIDPEIPHIGYGDWHIADVSPCQDPENTTPAVSMDTDIDAEGRVYGSTLDIGADEWSGTEPQVPTPSVIYVKPSSQGGSDSNDGTSWATAAATVQKGIDLAYATGNCEVWVAAGTYVPSSTITLKSGVRLYGGFAGTETSREQRNWVTHKTVLDGNNARTVVSIQSTVAAMNTIIDGFTVKRGYASTSGAGISCSGASATIANNIIRANIASLYGGGLYSSGSTLDVVGNVFVCNKASSGAGIFFTNTGGHIANNTVIGNDGIGVYLSSGAALPAFSNNIIAFNNGGGIYKSSGEPTFTRNDVYGNSGNGKYEYSWTTTYPVGTDLVPTEPGIPFIDYGDWHIAETSPCHDPQDTILAVPMDTDIDVETRVYDGSTVDIGADEWNGTDPQVPAPGVVYVKPSSQGGSDSNDGASWNTAVATIQKGIDLAYPDSSEVWVAAGTYNGTSGRATLKSFVKLYGGFAVGDTSKSTRNWKNNLTILDGASGGSVLTMSNVVGCAVDGFVIRSGSGYYNSSYSRYYGGGIYCTNAIATITNNIIRANNTSTSSYGAGIYASASTLTVAGNVFIDNKAGSGGGIYYTDTAGLITNNTIIGNSASTDGGGIYVNSGSPALSNNIVAFNTGGGIYKYTGASPTFAKDDVYGNGGYQYSWTTTYPVDTDLTPTDPAIPYADLGDWHIAEASPCHDPQGTVLAVPMDKDIDVEGRSYNGSTVDIGADEWNGTDPQAPASSVIYVKPSTQGGSDSNNGAGWDTAVATVQKGIDLSYAGGGGEVWVAAGTYVKSGSATTVANLKSFVKVYGGFAVGDISRNVRDWKTNKTVMDGGASGAVVTAISAVGCVIDGFTIRNGNGYSTGGWSSYNYGGGIYCFNASAVVMNNILRANTVSGSTYFHGGGIYASGSTLTMAGNVLVSNTAAGYGGGIYYANTGGHIANNTIITNSGVGIYLGSGPTLPTLSNNIIAFNTGGGIYKASDIPTCTRNDVYGNSGYQYSWTTTYPVGTDLTPSPPEIPYIDYGDWHISGSSPCHDPEGTVLAVLMDRDLDVENRVYNGSTVDIGADEWSGTEPQLPTPSVVYVKPSAQGGNDSNDGTSWATAVATVQKGIDLAYVTGNCEVWVAAGSYVPSSTITLKSGVGLYGGFAGTETARGQRNWSTHRTILDGNDSKTVVSVQSGSSAAYTVIDGFTIQRGSATGGAGIYCSSASATIRHNRIMLNRASSGGGGISCYSSASVIANNWIVGNTAQEYYGGFDGYYAGTGAGISLQSFTGSVINNTIAANEALSDGGGVYVKSSTTAQFKNNIVAFNSSGVYAYEGSSQNQCWSKNYVYGNALYQYSWTETCPSADIYATADPKFLDRMIGDFHILTGSPCINAGDAVANSIDIDGDSCTDGLLDVGADEWNGTDPVSSPTIVRVSPSGQDNNPLYDGSSWALTKQTIQKGIDTVAAAGGGEVRVKGASGAGISYNESIKLRPFVTVYGGYDESDSRDWRSNLTIVDATGKNASAVTVNEAYLVCAIDGFTIQHGTASFGGGICCQFGSPLIEHNTIQLNSSSDAGGIGCGKGATAVIRSNILKSNSATGYGGGIYCGWAKMINNGIVGNSAQYGAGIYCSSASLRCEILNTTIANNTLLSGGDCGGIYLNSVVNVGIYNSIIASNAGAGIKMSNSPHSEVLFKCNDVWGQTPNYDGVSDQTGGGGNISIDPLLDAVDHLHIQADQYGNDCKDKGRNDVLGDCAEDIDGDYRVQYGTVDIGADEILGCASEIIVMDPSRTIGLPDASYTLTACVTNPWTHQPVSGRHVDFEITSGDGEILSITNGQVAVPPTSGWGETDANGMITLTLEAGSAFGRVILTASTQSSCGPQISATSSIELGNRVGLAYDLCGDDKEYVAGVEEDYLQRLDLRYSDVAYSRIGSLQSGLQDSYDTIFVVMPRRSLNSSELSALTSFVQSGRHKRVVLVGEYGQSYATYNARLNEVAVALSINSRFSTAYSGYDGGVDRDRLCPVEANHYLMAGVANLWCAATDEFSGWQGNARPLAYIYSAQTKPWVVEEDTLSAGSIVAVHDSNIGDTGYNDSYDTVPAKNFKFLYNLCTIYPQ